MPFNVNQFRQQMTGDGARPNLFEVKMVVPPWAKPGAYDVARKISFFANAASLPGSTLGVAPAFYFGREAKFAGNRTYQDWTITVMNDEDFAVRTAFERWHTGINDPVLNVRSQYAPTVDSGYGVDAEVWQYGKQGGANPVKSYKFYGMFPIDISPIELAWNANDTIEEFQVTFAYQYWVAGDSASASSAIPRGLI